MLLGSIEITTLPQTRHMTAWDEGAIGLLNRESRDDLAAIRHLTNPLLAQMIQGADQIAQYRFYDGAQGFVSIDGGHHWYLLTDLAENRRGQPKIQEHCQAIFERAMAFNRTEARAHHPLTEPLHERVRHLPTLHDARLRTLEHKLAVAERERDELADLVRRQNQDILDTRETLRENAQAIEDLTRHLRRSEAEVAVRDREIHQLKGDIAHLREDLATSERRVAQLEALPGRIRVLEAALGEAQARIADRDHLAENLERTQEQLQEAREALGAAERENRGLRGHLAQIPALRDQIERLEATLDQTTEALEAANAQIQDQQALQGQIRDLQGRLGDLTADLRRERGESQTLRAANQELAERIDSLTPLVEQLDQQAEALATMRGQLLEMGTLQDEVTLLHAEVLRLRGVDDELRALQEAHATQEMANQALARDTERLPQLEALLREKEDQIAALTADLEATKQNFARAHQSNQLLNEDLEALRRELAVVKEENAHLQESLRSKTQELNTQTRARQDAEATSAQLSLRQGQLLEEKAALTEKCSRLEQAAAKLQAQNATLLQAVQKAQSERDALQQENDEMRSRGLPPGALSAADARKLEAANRGLNEGLAARAAENDELRDENAQLREQLAQAQRVQDAAREQLAEAQTVHAAAREELEHSLRELEARLTEEKRAAAAAAEKTRVKKLLKTAVKRGNELIDARDAASAARKAKKAAETALRAPSAAPASLQGRDVVAVASPRALSPEPTAAPTRSEREVVALEVEVAALKKTLAQREARALELEGTIRRLQLQLSHHDAAKAAAIAEVEQAGKAALAKLTQEHKEALLALVEQEEEIKALKTTSRRQRDDITGLEAEKERSGVAERKAQRQLDTLREALRASEERKALLESELARLQEEFSGIDQAFRKIETEAPAEIERLQDLIRDKEALLETARKDALRSAGELAPLNAKIQALESELRSLKTHNQRIAEEQELMASIRTAFVSYQKATNLEQKTRSQMELAQLVRTCPQHSPLFQFGRSLLDHIANTSELETRLENLAQDLAAKDASIALFETEKRVIEELQRIFNTIQETPARDRSIALDRQMAELAESHGGSTTIQSFFRLIQQATGILSDHHSLESALAESRRLLTEQALNFEILDAKCRHLEEQLAEMPALRQELETHRGAAERTAHELQQNTDLLRLAQRELAQVRAGLDREREQIAEEAQAQIDEARKQVEGLEATFQSIQTAYAESQETAFALRSTLKKQTQKISELEEVRDGQSTRITELTTKIEGLQKKLSADIDADADVEEEMASRAAELRRVQKENVALTEELEGLRAHEQQTLEELEAARETISTFEAHFLRVEPTLTHLRGQIAQLEDSKGAILEGLRILLADIRSRQTPTTISVEERLEALIEAFSAS